MTEAHTGDHPVPHLSRHRRGGPGGSLRRRASSLAICLVAGLALSACVEGNPFAKRDGASAGETSEAAPKIQRSTRIVERDVEAPQVFQVADTALWDGRPSLGGVWVASPDTKDPERVIMRNPANGKFVIGALFRRERDNPGPKLQISSDAADALGILAGQPVKISVTALRREEVPEATPEAPILDSNETLAGATAPGAKPATAAPAPGTKPGAILAGGVETKPLDAAPGAKPAAGARPVAPAAAAAKPAAPAAAPAPAASGTGRLIQIGIFSVEANAKRAVDTLAKAGIKADIRAGNTQGKAHWSVATRGDAAALAKVKSAGFSDAYMLK